MRHALRAVAEFRVIVELRSPHAPTFEPVRRQLAVIAPSASAILVPENAVGVASISSAAVAVEVFAHGANPIICLTRLSSAAPAIFPERGYIPAVSLQVDEQVAAVSDANMPGAEGSSMWSATVRFGDVPVLTMDSADRQGLIRKVSELAANLGRASDEWRKQAAAGSIYPTVFRGRSTGTNYEISMVWKFDQGTRGVPLIQI